jgi:NADPH2:quinone reductase
MDLLQREGKYPLPPAASKTIMGVEFSGVIVSLGPPAAAAGAANNGDGGSSSADGKNWKIGDEVFGLAYGGAYAEYIAVSTKMMVRKPERLSWVEAAGVPENWLTGGFGGPLSPLGSDFPGGAH